MRNENKEYGFEKVSRLKLLERKDMLQIKHWKLVEDYKEVYRKSREIMRKLMSLSQLKTSSEDEIVAIHKEFSRRDTKK